MSFVSGRKRGARRHMAELGAPALDVAHDSASLTGGASSALRALYKAQRSATGVSDAYTSLLWKRWRAQQPAAGLRELYEGRAATADVLLRIGGDSGRVVRAHRSVLEARSGTWR